MVEVLGFENFDDMRAWMEENLTAANRELHPAQKMIGYGDYWVRFVDLPNRIVEFGRVSERDEVYQQELDAGATVEEAQYVLRTTAESLNRGFLYGIAYSVLNRDGEWGTTHKANVWPIDEALFMAAAEARFQIDMLPVSQKVNLEVAFRAVRSHVRKVSA